MVIGSFLLSLSLFFSEAISVCPDEQVTTLDLLAIKHIRTFSPRLVDQLCLAIAHTVVDSYVKPFRNWFHTVKSSDQYCSAGDQNY